jgi:uncharacterized beta-barrel protein YwiB (DUF1934 family)
MCKGVLQVSTRPAEQVPVKVLVKTVVDEETYEMTTFGHYFIKGSSAYLKYEESMPEGTIQTTVKVKDAEVLILRKGAVDMRLHFLLNKITSGTYKTPHGLLMTEADTKKIELEDGRIEIRYHLSIQGSRAGTYHMNINYEKA